MNDNNSTDGLTVMSYCAEFDMGKRVQAITRDVVVNIKLVMLKRQKKRNKVYLQRNNAQLRRSKYISWQLYCMVQKVRLKSVAGVLISQSDPGVNYNINLYPFRNVKDISCMCQFCVI